MCLRLASEDLEKAIKYTGLELGTVVRDICLKVIGISTVMVAVGIETLLKENIQSEEMRASRSSDI